MPLQKKVQLEGNYGILPVNVYNIRTHEIVFTGSVKDTARFLSCSEQTVWHCLKYKYRHKKKYAIRIKSAIKK